MVDRAKYKEALLKKTQDSYDRREDSGRFGSIFKSDLSGVPFWKCKAADHLIDIIPYIAGPDDPKNKEGEIVYFLDVLVHQGVGGNENSYVCPGSYGKRCPICEHRQLLRKDDDYDEDLVKSLNSSRRAIYNVLVYDTEKEEDKGVQVWEVAHWFMERHLTPLAKDPRTAALLPFTDPDEGKSVSFERHGSGQTGTSYLGHKFVDRDYVIPDEVLDSVHCLDQLITQTSYEELYEAYWGEPMSSESDVSAGVTRKASPAEEQPVEERKPTTRLRGGSAKPEEEQRPATTGRRRSQQAASSETPKEESVERCKGGGVFGSDLDHLDGCNNCEIYDDCAIESDKIEAEEKKKKEEVRVGGTRRGGQRK